jgi:hypothetical protein
MFSQADDILRMRGWAAAARFEAGALRRAAGLTLLFGVAYGAVMGTYAAWAGSRTWNDLLLQMTYSALKVPLLLAATCLVALPSFFVLNTLFGLRDDFRLAVRAVAATQAGVAIILSSLAPLTLIWYWSSASYYPAILFNGAMFAVASISAQRLLRAHYRPLIARNARHRTMLRMWLFLYSLVGIQMAWMLRPFIGSLSDPVEFFRKETLDNAYVIVSRLLCEALR